MLILGLSAGADLATELCPDPEQAVRSPRPSQEHPLLIHRFVCVSWCADLEFRGGDAQAGAGHHCEL